MDEEIGGLAFTEGLAFNDPLSPKNAQNEVMICRLSTADSSALCLQAAHGDMQIELHVMQLSGRRAIGGFL